MRQRSEAQDWGAHTAGIDKTGRTGADCCGVGRQQTDARARHHVPIRHRPRGVDGRSSRGTPRRCATAPRPVWSARPGSSDGPTVGGFCLFEDREVADRYLDGMFAEAVTANPAFSDVRVERYDVDEALSRITNGLGAQPVGARS